MTEEMMPTPLWLTAAVDQRLALMAEHIPAPHSFDNYNVVMTPLTEPVEGATEEERERWDQSCDNCGKHCPTTLVTGEVRAELHGRPVHILFGACPECAQKETP